MIYRRVTGSQIQTSSSQHIFIAYFTNIRHVSGNTSGLNSITVVMFIQRWSVKTNAVLGDNVRCQWKKCISRKSSTGEKFVLDERHTGVVNSVSLKVFVKRVFN